MNINWNKLILQIIRGAHLPASSPNYPENWLVRKTIKFLDEKIIESEIEFNKPIPRWRKYAINRAYKQLIIDKAIQLDSSGKPQITAVGDKLLSQYTLTDYFVDKNIEPWDQKYRVVSFDISVMKNKERHLLRRQLVEWGFIRLQNSVWVFPYDCLVAISLLKSSFGIVTEVIYMTVESIENDKWLRDSFGLS